MVRTVTADRAIDLVVIDQQVIDLVVITEVTAVTKNRKVKTRERAVVAAAVVAMVEVDPSASRTKSKDILTIVVRRGEKRNTRSKAKEKMQVRKMILTGN